MKTFLVYISVIALFFPNGANARQDSLSGVHIGLIYPLSTNGKAAGQISNHFSLHLLSGYSKRETGFSLSGFANVIRETAEGVQIAGLVNHTGLNASGVQIAGIGNCVKDTASGLQVSGVYNVSGAAHSQVSGFLNMSGRDAGGVQIAGFANKARDVHSQIGGFINIARNVKGVQVSGFLNIADSSDYAIGVVNLIKNGEKGLGIHVDETMTTTLTFRSGGRKLYTIVGAGYNKRPNGQHYLAFEGGVGHNWHFNRYFRLKGELVSRTLTADFDDDSRYTVSLRLLPALKIANRIEVFGGPSLNYTYHEKEGEPFNLPKKYIWTNDRMDDFHGMYAGWTVGLQVFF